MIFPFIVLIGFSECNSTRGRSIKREKYENVSLGGRYEATQLLFS